MTSAPTAADFKAVGDEIGYEPQAVAFCFGRFGNMSAVIAYLLSIDENPAALRKDTA